MKRIMLMGVIALMLGACSKKDEPQIDPPEQLTHVEQLLSELKIKPSNAKDINNIGGVIDSTSYKLVCGMMNNNAWLAKFDANGNEIFAYQFKDTHEGMNNSYLFDRNILCMNKHIILFFIYITDNPDPFGSWSSYSSYASRLCVIDFNTGNEIHKFSFTKNDQYNLTKTPFSYLVESFVGAWNPDSYYLSVSFDGQKFWERNLGEYEVKGLGGYKTWLWPNSEYPNGKEPVFVDDESFVHISGSSYGNVFVDNNNRRYDIYNLLMFRTS